MLEALAAYRRRSVALARDIALDGEKRAAGGPKRAILEVSGGVTLERIPELARTGVDVISVGALTHSAPAADLALDFA